MNKYIFVEQIKSCIRTSNKSKSLIKSLGLKKINHKVLRKNCVFIRMIIFKLQNLVSISKFII